MLSLRWDSTDEAKADGAVNKASARGYISFPASSRELEVIPAYPDPLTGESTTDITGLAEAANFLYLINPETYGSKDEFLTALKTTSTILFLSTHIGTEVKNTLRNKSQV